MHLTGAELLNGDRGELKFLLNESGILFFPTTQEHRDTKAPGLRYADDYRGNAVAGIVTLDRVEIRFHRDFSAERIRRLGTAALKMPEVAGAGLGSLWYQGKEIG